LIDDIIIRETFSFFYCLAISTTPRQITAIAAQRFQETFSPKKIRERIATRTYPALSNGNAYEMLICDTASNHKTVAKANDNPQAQIHHEVSNRSSQDPGFVPLDTCALRTPHFSKI
jgi:hypothetical protein